jgi:hypothetical protein
LTGSYTLSFERRIYNFVTVQASAGLTGKNILRTAIVQADNNLKVEYPWNEQVGFDIADAALTFENRRAKMEYMFAIQPRLYVQSEAPEGSFLGVSYKYFKYKFAIPDMVANGNGIFEHNGNEQNE